MTPSDIRYAYERGGERGDHPASRHFFKRDTMKFFGDTMRSFGVKTIGGQVILYRKPTAKVNVFGTWKEAGREFFGAWRFDPNDGDLHGIYDKTAKSAIYARVAR